MRAQLISVAKNVFLKPAALKTQAKVFKMNHFLKTQSYSQIKLNRSTFFNENEIKAYFKKVRLFPHLVSHHL